MSFPPRPSSRRLVESRRGLLFGASTRQSPFVRNEAGCPAKNRGASALKTPFCTCGTPGGEVDARQNTANQVLHSKGPAASRCREPLKHDASLEEGAMASNGGHRLYQLFNRCLARSVRRPEDDIPGIRAAGKRSEAVHLVAFAGIPGLELSPHLPTQAVYVHLPPASPQPSGPRRASNLFGPTPVPSRRLTFACRSCINHFRRRVPFASIISVSPSRPLNLDRRPPDVLGDRPPISFPG
jgi:hypothetical protein